MAQRTEKEETEFKVVPDTISLCVNNCGVTGNPATKNMCQNCFNATTASSSAAALVGKFSAGEGVKSPRSTFSRPAEKFVGAAETSRSPRARDPAVAVKKEVNRCSGCRKRVGLTGFRCRCGELFCAEHRYSDRHDCSYDYKAAGREAIARENPVVKAAKIVRV